MTKIILKTIIMTTIITIKYNNNSNKIMKSIVIIIRRIRI